VILFPVRCIEQGEADWRWHQNGTVGSETWVSSGGKKVKMGIRNEMNVSSVRFEEDKAFSTANLVSSETIFVHTALGSDACNLKAKTLVHIERMRGTRG